MTLHSKLTALTLFSALLSAPFAHADEAKDAPLARQLNLTKASLRHQGRDRTFYYHGRINQRSKALKPVLFVLHGGGGSGPDTANKTGYNPVAQDNGFLVVYPNGWQGNWNDGRGKPAATGVDVSNIDDVGFFRKLFDYTAQTLKGDPQRFYVTGLSNGGTMSYRLGIELTDRIAAIAPVIANLTGPLQTATPKRPLPVLIMNGTADPLMHWGGSTNPDGSVAQLSTPETVTWWIRHNAQRRLVLPRSEHLPNVNRQDDSTVEVTTYTGLVAPVVLYTIHGGGHTFPGSDVKDVPQLVGAKNMDIDGREEVWAFVSQFKLD